MELPMDYDSVEECVRAGIDIFQYTAEGDEFDTTAKGAGAETDTMSIAFENTSAMSHESELDSAGKPLQGISLFDKMMRDAAKEAYDPSIGRFIPSETVHLSPNREIIKTDLNYIGKMASQKKEMTKVVDATIKRRELEAERNRPRRGEGSDPAERSEADKLHGTLVFQAAQDLVAKEPKLPCALCEHLFPVSALLGRITFKTVGEWRAAHCAPIPAEDKRFNYAYIHNAAKLCLLCTSFFDKDFSDCVDRSGIHEAIGLAVDPLEGVVDLTNKDSRRLITTMIEAQAAPDRPLSAIKHKVAVKQIKEWKERNNDPNAKFLYNPKAMTGSKFIVGAADARTLRDTYTDNVMVKTLQERGRVEERNAKEREVKRKQWLDRLSGKMPNTSPPKKDKAIDKDSKSSSRMTRNTSRERKEKENNPNSARSDSGTIGRRGKSRSPSVSRSKTAGNALETVNERGRRRNAAKRGESLNRRGGSVTSQKSIGSVSSNKSSKTTATVTSTRSLGGQRGRARSTTGGSIKSSGYTSAPWGATPVKIKQSRGSSLPPNRSQTTGARTTKHPAVPRLSGRAMKEAKNAPKPVERKALLVMVRDRKTAKGTKVLELQPARRKAEEETAVQLRNPAVSGIDPSRSLVSTSSTKKNMVVPIDSLVQNKRVSKQQEQLIRSAASAYNPQGVYSPPENKRRKQPSVVTRSTHAASAVPSAEEAAIKKAYIEEKIAQKMNTSLSRRSMSPPASVRLSQASSAFGRDKSKVGEQVQVQVQAEASKLSAPAPFHKVRPKLEIQTKPTKQTEPIKNLTVVEKIENAATEYVVSDISDDEDENEGYIPTGLAAKLAGRSIDGSIKKSPSPAKDIKFAVGTDDDAAASDYDDDSEFDAYDVAHMAESALNEASQLDSSAHETPIDFLPGEDTMDQYMFASAGLVQKPENPDKWSPEEKLPGQNSPSRFSNANASALQKQLFSLDAAFGEDSASPIVSPMKGGMFEGRKSKKSPSPQKVGFQVQEHASPPLSYHRVPIKGINSSKGERRYIENSPGDNSQGSDQSACFGDKSYSSPAGEDDKRSKEMYCPTAVAQQELIDRLEWQQLTPAASKLSYEEAMKAQKDLSDAYSFMGDTCKDAGDLSAALSAYENAFRLERDEIATNPDLVQKKLESLVVLAINAGENDKATNLCEEMVSMSLDVYGEKSIEFAKSEVFTSKILLYQGEPVDAAELLNDAVIILEKAVGKQHQLAVEARAVLADALNEAIAKHNKLHGSPTKESPKKTSPKKKKTKATSSRLTETKKSPSKAAVAEQQVQMRIAEEVAEKMAEEKKKMQAAMERKIAKQVEEQMAAMQATMKAQMREQMELQLKIQAKFPSPVPHESIISALDSLAEQSIETSQALGSPASTIGGSVEFPNPASVKQSPKKKGVRMASPAPSPSPSPPPSPPADSPPRSSRNTSPNASMLANTTLSPTTNPYAPEVASASAASLETDVELKNMVDKSPEIVMKQNDNNYVIDMSAYETRASPLHAAPSPKKVQYTDPQPQSPLSPQVLMQSPNEYFLNKTLQSARLQGPPDADSSAGKKAVRMRSPPPLAVRLDDSGNSKSSAENPVAPPKPRVRIHSPPPQPRPVSADDEELEEGDEEEVVQIDEYTDLHLMKLALGNGDVSDDDYAYDDGDFEESADAPDASGVDENAGPNTPPKPRPSSVNRKLQTHVQNARGMELLDSGTKSLSPRFKRLEEEKGIAMLTAGQHGESYGPNGASEGQESMKLLTMGAGGINKRSALHSRERKPELAEGQSGMVMLSKGSSFVNNKVASIAVAELHDGEDGEADISNKSVKHRIKRK